MKEQAGTRLLLRPTPRQHIAAAEPARLARVHTAANRALVMLTVVKAWGYAPGDDLTAALDTARRLHALTA
jgi:hypothetical protein